jgi:hypothetical protein
MKISPLSAVLVSIVSTLATALAIGCGGHGATHSSGGGGAGSGTNSTNGSSSGIIFTTNSGMSTGTNTGTASGGPCTGLECQIHACSGGGSTTISGTIYDPAGKNPLYGVVAYVPNTTPSPLTSGTSCYSCDSLYTGTPIAAAISDVKGNFTIPKAPDGKNIPLVIQVGKWRRQFLIPSVGMCTNTAVPMMLTLPKNGSEGDLPNMAISTGGADTLECLLTRVGVDPAEYVPGPAGSGHVHIFAGTGGPDTSPPSPAPEQGLWDSAADIMKYDITILSCEGHETDNMNQQVLMDYTNSCGRVFASHFHYAWFNTGPFAAYNLAEWTTGSNQIGNSLDANVVTNFPMGKIFHDWLANVGALNTNGELTIYAPRHNADLAPINTNSQAWLLADMNSQSPGAAQDFSFDTPLSAMDAGARQGRTVYSDMHVGAVPNGVQQDYGGGGGTTPMGCVARDLTAQEKALEFILFNLSSCVTPGGGVQPPPPTMTPPTQ